MQLPSTRGSRGMAVTPHALASQSALGVLREGGNAVEAMVAAAATIAVVYPHMNSIGGDGFWLIARPGEAPRGLEGCGAAAARATIAHYKDAGHAAIPFRGGMAACTVAGTVSGWDAALQYSRDALDGRLPLSRLLDDAVVYARDGAPVTPSQARCVAAKRTELEGVPGYAESFLQPGQTQAGERMVQPRLADTLMHLARRGLDDFYRGELAESFASDLAHVGSPVGLGDLHAHRAVWKTPLELTHTLGTVWNMPPPTQGLVALLILGQLDRLLKAGMDPLGADYVHACVEATKQAFLVRDRVITDPAYMDIDPQLLLEGSSLDTLTAAIDAERAMPWGAGHGPADTVWMGVIDRTGLAVSFIQSIYHEFGSGVVLARSGVNWQNRGCSFSLDPSARNPLTPGRKPFHTLIPAMARLADGRTMVYGNMGGDGQPQSQGAVFSRIAVLGMDPQAAITAPRWLLGRTWGQTSDTLKLESRFPDATVQALRARGHQVDLLAPFDETMGHAGAVIHHPSGLFEGGFDPRSDGCVAAW
ncbi:gamma-glutamyltransferase family protein [Variovorax ginsengisoli]|uniref:Gamma-glutamyltranspeptidase/glutathione hydrolase n=1 Tax=Variovorax ginsengisoli TaxID=363844 RepID=A0ABT9SBI0_9BURK|nr:gamma-glutamyltransferase [Variovorax ginsengisoli]MDP9901707.1 gamma-glutamyltranspeptidase/glutathione hydrolase [Variovorax ginsengisoli]